MSCLTKLPVIEVLNGRNIVFSHKYESMKTTGYLMAFFAISKSGADDELTNNHQDSLNDSLSPDNWNSTEISKVIIWDEGTSIVPPQEIQDVRIH